MARTICDCPHPPGGRVECDPDDVAFCIVDDSGLPRSGCLRVTPSVAFDLQIGNTLAIVQWLVGAFQQAAPGLRASTRDEVTLENAIQRRSQSAAPIQHRFSTGHQVNFKLPGAGGRP